MAAKDQPPVALNLPSADVEVVDLLSDDADGSDLTAEESKEPARLAGNETEGSAAGDDGLWESTSLYEDAVEEIQDHQYADGDEHTCTLEEALAFRKLLRAVGPDEFVAHTIERDSISAKKLCTAFGLRPPSFLDGQPDEAYYPLLGLGISRELAKRSKLHQHNTVQDAVSLLKNSKNIIVLTGAGISTSLGIPDFRSKDTGLYARIEHLGLSDPQEVFDIHIFREDPSVFYSVARDILPSTKRFSPTHAFIRLLQDKGKLLTNFTQNIDNVEVHAGILPERLVQCHGSFATASCQQCHHKVDGEGISKDIMAGRIPRCDRCLERIRQTGIVGTKRRRGPNSHSSSKSKRRPDYEDSTDDEDVEIAVAGVMKPDITFFGEDLPATFHDRLARHDRDLVDLVLVIGTSLKVAPVSEVSGFLPPDVPQIYISRDPCPHVNFDIELLGECDVVVAELSRRAGWDLRHEMIPASARVLVQTVEGYESRHAFVGL